MNELAVRIAVKQLILDNEADLITGLTFQGQPRSIHQVSYSGVTPPTGYFFINVTTSNNRTTNWPGFGRTTAMTQSEATHTVNIDVSDYITGYPGENQLFEKMDAEFQLFTDRIVAKLRETYEIPNTTLRLDTERSVTKSNLSTGWEEAAQYHALLYARITFSVVDKCTDDATLY